MLHDGIIWELHVKLEGIRPEIVLNSLDVEETNREMESL